MRDDFVLQHYGDDEPEPDSEATVGYHELDDSELEKWKRNFSCHDPPVCEWFFLPEAKEMTTQMTISGRNSHLPATDRALELLTQEEAAVFLHKSPRVLRLWRTAGIGPAYVKLGKTVLYNRDDLITYVRSNTVQPSVRAAFEEENCGAL